MKDFIGHSIPGSEEGLRRNQDPMILLHHFPPAIQTTVGTDGSSDLLNLLSPRVQGLTMSKK